MNRRFTLKYFFLHLSLKSKQICCIPSIHFILSCTSPVHSILLYYQYPPHPILYFTRTLVSCCTPSIHPVLSCTSPEHQYPVLHQYTSILLYIQYPPVISCTSPVHQYSAVHPVSNLTSVSDDITQTNVTTAPVLLLPHQTPDGTVSCVSVSTVAIYLRGRTKHSSLSELGSVTQHCSHNTAGLQWVETRA